MSVELYINDERVDLTGDEVIASDYSFYDIAKLESRNGALSINFRIKRTEKNRAIFEQAEAVNNNSVLPYTRLKARLLDSGVDMRIRFAEIKNSNAFYNVRLYGDNSDFFAAIKDLKLSDLDLIDLNHFLTISTAANSRTNNSGYIYPIIDYYTNSPNNNLNETQRRISVQGMLPSLFHKTILQRACQKVGYTLTDNTELPTGVDLVVPAVQPLRDFDGRRYEVSLTYEETTVTDIDTARAVAINAQTSNYFTANNIYNIDSGGIKRTMVADEIDADFDVNITLTAASAGANVSLYIGVSQPGASFALVPIELNLDVAESPATTNVQKRVRGSIKLDRNNECYFFLGAIKNTLPNITIQAGATVDVSNVVVVRPLPIVYDPANADTIDYVTLGNIADLKVSEILSDYLNMFCSVINADNTAKTVTINNFKLIGENKYKAIDWSEKVDYTDETNVTYTIDNYAQLNAYRYEDDESVIKPFGTDANIEVENENLPLLKETVKVKYSATQSNLRMKDLLVPNLPIYFFDNSVPLLGIEQKPKPRILLLRRVDAASLPDTSNLRYRDGAGHIDVSTDFPLAWFIDTTQPISLGFGSNLFALYFGALQSVLRRVKAVKELVRLTPTDINQLDFFTPVYIARHNAYFYVSKISSYLYGSAKSVIVNLIKL